MITHRHAEARPHQLVEEALATNRSSNRAAQTVCTVKSLILFFVRLWLAMSPKTIRAENTCALQLRRIGEPPGSKRSLPLPKVLCSFVSLQKALPFSVTTQAVGQESSTDASVGYITGYFCAHMFHSNMSTDRSSQRKLHQHAELCHLSH